MNSLNKCTLAWALIKITYFKVGMFIVFLKYMLSTGTLNHTSVFLSRVYKKMFSKLKTQHDTELLSGNHSDSKIPPTQLTPKLYLSGLMGKSNYNLQMQHIDLIINATNEVQLSEYKAKKGNKLYEIRIPVDDKPEERLAVYFMVYIFHVPKYFIRLSLIHI